MDIPDEFVDPVLHYLADINSGNPARQKIPHLMQWIRKIVYFDEYSDTHSAQVVTAAVPISRTFSANGITFLRTEKTHAGFTKREKEMLSFLTSLLPEEVSENPKQTMLKSSRELPKSFGYTIREAEIIHLVQQGNSNRKIAEQLSITEGTVKQHLFNIFNKTGVDSRIRLLYVLSQYDQSGE